MKIELGVPVNDTHLLSNRNGPLQTEAVENVVVDLLCALAHFPVNKGMINMSAGKTIGSARAYKFVVRAFWNSKIFVAAVIGKIKFQGL